jgi:hypothetical protein
MNVAMLAHKFGPLQLLSVAQGLFYLATGIWPLVSISSFQSVTGPKTDLWLVKTAGVLITVIGGVLVLAGMRRRVTPEISLLAIGSAAGLTGIDLVYVAKRRIPPIYLLDALVELGLIGGWLTRLGGNR